MNALSTERARAVLRRVRGLPTSDGAGVKLTRVIGTQHLDMLDPFLMLDEFGTDRAEDYIAGFPDHPHRGFETVTYMLDGRMRHRDNHGNEGLLVPGAVQWMTAGRGIVHSEMPEQQEGRMRGFQLWVNLPASQKMSAPRYQEFGPERIPELTPADGVRVKLIAGEIDGVRGPVTQPATDPLYVDVHLGVGGTFAQALPSRHHAFVYVYEGAARVGEGDQATRIDTRELAVLGEGGRLVLTGESPDTRAIVVAGRPIGEPVARYGPFVMNTREEILQAFEDFKSGRF